VKTDANTEVRLAEFASLRQEVNQRSITQQALIALNLTVAGTISGLVVAGTCREKLFLAVSFASTTFGLLWLDHHLSIHQIADYIKSELWSWDPSWEHHARKKHKPPWWQAIYLFAIMLTFVGISAVALAIAMADTTGGFRALWWGGALLVLISGSVFSVVFLRGPAQLK